MDACTKNRAHTQPNRGRVSSPLFIRINDILLKTTAQQQFLLISNFQNNISHAHNLCTLQLVCTYMCITWQSQTTDKINLTHTHMVHTVTKHTIYNLISCDRHFTRFSCPSDFLCSFFFLSLFLSFTHIFVHVILHFF